MGLLQRSRRDKSGDLFRDERGFTTTSMVLSILITLALIFTAAQVYRINSISAEVQDVADAAALSAESQVGEFMIIARFCDAVVLSLSLASITVYAVGVVAICARLPVASQLLKAGREIADVRNKFADKASRVLNKLQEALPFFAAACAANVAIANNGDSEGSNYLGIALLLPTEGETIEVGSGGDTDEFADSVEEKADEIDKKSEEAERASEGANHAKQLGFEYDCGNSPGHCMYERALNLIGLSGSANPMYSSPDTWSFSVALNRAKSYYASRRNNDTPRSGSVKDRASSELQKRFCAFAYDLLLREGYVHETESSFDANFPHVPSKVAEMRETTLYTERAYPVTRERIEGNDEEVEVMHAWSGCPGAKGPIAGYESISYMESNELQTCSQCSFTVQSMGNIASTTTSINTGFQYHYEAVARQAEEYEKEMEKANEAKSRVKEETSGVFDKLKEVVESIGGKRIDVSPPGSDGALALVVNVGQTSVAGGFANGFVASSGSLGPRAAISAATLVDEGTDEGRTVLNSLLDGLRENGGVAVGALGIVLDLWSMALSAYSKGINAITDGIEGVLGFIPLKSASGLGTWVADKLRDVLKGIGLEPVELGALKPVLVNSAHVAARDNGAVGSTLMSIKAQVIAHPLYSTDLFSGFLSDVEKTALSKVEGLGSTIEVASIELFDGLVSIPIVIPLPQQVTQFGVGVIQGLFDRIRGVAAQIIEVRAWE